MLHYGFPRGKKWKAKYDALTDVQKKFFHGGWSGLGTLMMVVGVQRITEKTIPIIVERANMLGIKLEGKFTIEFFEPFIGFGTNVSNEGSNEWFKRHCQHKVTRSKLMEMCKGFDDEDDPCECPKERHMEVVPSS